MESISQLVSDSLARHGMEPSLDHLRLEWSRWFRCESSFSVLLMPAKPGIFSLGEEMIPAGDLELRASSPVEGKRMLALFQISETDDLGMALGRLFLPGNPLRERLTAGRCFVRYTVIEDVAQRSAACAIFQCWMQRSAETASGISSCGAEPALSERPQGESRMGALARDTNQQPPCGSDKPCGSDIPVRADREKACGADTPVRVAETENKSAPDPDVDKAVPPSNSSAWGVGFMEVQNREAREVVRRPAPLPSGF